MFTAWGRWPRLTPKPPTERVEPLLLELELLTWVSVKLLSITTPDQLIPFRLKYWTIAKRPTPTTMTTITIRNILFCMISGYKIRLLCLFSLLVPYTLHQVFLLFPLYLLVLVPYPHTLPFAVKPAFLLHLPPQLPWLAYRKKRRAEIFRKLPTLYFQHLSLLFHGVPFFVK